MGARMVGKERERGRAPCCSSALSSRLIILLTASADEGNVCSLHLNYAVFYRELRFRIKREEKQVKK